MAASGDQPPHNDDVQGVSATKLLFHRVSEGCRSMAQVLGIRRLHEFIQVRDIYHCCKMHTTRLQQGSRRYTCVQGTTTISNEAVWLLGTYYAVRDSDTNTDWLTPEVRVACIGRVLPSTRFRKDQQHSNCNLVV